MDLFHDDDSEVLFDDEYESSVDNYVTSQSLDSADCLKKPSAMSFCLGHDEEEKFILDMYLRNCIPHALIFAGPQGIGKTTFAFRVARFLLKNGKSDIDQVGLFGDSLPSPSFISLDVDSNDLVFTRIASGGHPDLLHVERAQNSAKNKDKSLDVESIRKIAPFLRKTASEGGWRVVIVEDADSMTRNAQNAVLKILEEPPAKVLIILIAHKPGMLIPTIRSRARQLNFKTLQSDTLLALMEKSGRNPSISEMEILRAVSAGSFGVALRYFEEEGIETLSTILRLLADMPSWKWVEIHSLADTLSSPSHEKSYRMFADLLQWVFREILFAKARGFNTLPTYISSESLNRFYHSASLAKLMELSDSLKNHFLRTDFSNLDKRETVRSAFVMLSH